MRTKFWLGLALIATSTMLIAQEIKPVSNDYRIETRTTTLQKTASPQTITFVLTAQSADNARFFSVNLEKSNVVWSLVSAQRDGAALWLIRSNVNPTRNEVLAWEYNEADNLLYLYPPAWSPGYELEVEVQVIMRNTRDLGDDDTDTLVADVESAAGSFRCAATGRGTNISLE